MAGIRLGLKTEPYWLDVFVYDRLGDDPVKFRVQVRPLTTALFNSATARAGERLAALTASLDDVEVLGGEVSGLPDLDDPHAREGVRQQFFAQDLALYAIAAWEGVYDEEGEPAPVNEEAVYAAMSDHLVSSAFLNAYTLEYSRRIEEGNGSRPAPNGISEEGQNTVKDAAPLTNPAPEESP